jgi:hypothetical protein
MVLGWNGMVIQLQGQSVPASVYSGVLTGLGVVLGLLVGLGAWWNGRVTAGPPGVRFTTAGLGKFLTEMGYPHKTGTANNGVLPYHLQVDRYNLNGMITINLSPDQTNLWISAFIRNVPERATRLDEHLWQLLKVNYQTGPVFFSVAEPRQLYLMRCLPNGNVTPALFRSALDDFIDVMARTADLWATENWELLSSDAQIRSPSPSPDVPPELRSAFRPMKET